MKKNSEDIQLDPFRALMILEQHNPTYSMFYLHETQLFGWASCQRKFTIPFYPVPIFKFARQSSTNLTQFAGIEKKLKFKKWRKILQWQ